MTAITKHERIVLAALFARTNMGMQAPPINVVHELLKNEKADLDNCVNAVCAEFLESEEQQQMFLDEGMAWFRQFEGMTREQIVETWPHNAAMVWTPSSYTIEINEYQRELIAYAINFAINHGMKRYIKNQPGGGAFDTKVEELDNLVKGIDDLPKVELKNPDVLHGFAV